MAFMYNFVLADIKQMQHFNFFHVGVFTVYIYYELIKVRTVNLLHIWHDGRYWS